MHGKHLLPTLQCENLLFPYNVSSELLPLPQGHLVSLKQNNKPDIASPNISLPMLSLNINLYFISCNYNQSEIPTLLFFMHVALCLLTV